jgi:hypothetical protein
MYQINIALRIYEFFFNNDISFMHVFKYLDFTI